ncbi:hypothetical protein Q1695_004505 [Nippostrongylus brasiliensis]|nr:hypothetical protein Q1695_004505 [Nippostrongylus brasiliensis]
MLEIEQIQDEAKLHTTLSESDDLSYMLTIRLDEAISVRDRMEVRLGYATPRSQRERVEREEEQSSSSNSNGHEEPSTVPVNADDDDLAELTIRQPRNAYRSIKPPQATLPKFGGNAEEFPEQ